MKTILELLLLAIVLYGVYAIVRTKVLHKNTWPFKSAANSVGLTVGGKPPHHPFN